MQNNSDGIVLLAKESGPTSFSSLHNVKKALNTTKVGHTGTLDSFAQGLLVVCTGRLTRLAGNITEFDKSYKAVIRFGTETDTLEFTGNTIKTENLPSLEKLKEVLPSFTGKLMQQPPAFSAIHVDGKRSSDLARSGQAVEIPARPITVYNADLLEYKLNDDGLVEACLIDFTVSKGTYIRSLARDIGYACGSVAHLLGLYRTRVGNFKIEDAAGFSKLPEFSIAQSEKQAEAFLQAEDSNKKFHDPKFDEIFQSEIVQKKQTVDEALAIQCGFTPIHIRDENSIKEFQNGKPLRNKLFVEDLFALECDSQQAVFYENNFYGLLYKNPEGRISYKFVIN